MSNSYKIVSISLVIFSTLFSAGCVYNDEPLPGIVHDYKKDAKLPSFSTAAVSDNINVPAGWLPPQKLENKNRWRGIVIHHSATGFGNVAYIDKLHKINGWDGMGYHFVINNGVFKKGYGKGDGVVEVGYRWRQQKNGAHCRSDGDRRNSYNKHTIGICLIGNFEKSYPTQRQKRSLVRLVRFLQKRYNIPSSQIKVHSQIKATDCPGKYFSLSTLKSQL